jgi:hypothetical protein
MVFLSGGLVFRELRLIHQKTQLQPTDPNDVGNSAFHEALSIVKCFYMPFVKWFYKNVNAVRS